MGILRPSGQLPAMLAFNLSDQAAETIHCAALGLGWRKCWRSITSTEVSTVSAQSVARCSLFTMHAAVFMIRPSSPNERARTVTRSTQC